MNKYFWKYWRQNISYLITIFFVSFLRINIWKYIYRVYQDWPLKSGGDAENKKRRRFQIERYGRKRHVVKQNLPRRWWKWNITSKSKHLYFSIFWHCHSSFSKFKQFATVRAWLRRWMDGLIFWKMPGISRTLLALTDIRATCSISLSTRVL